eukprot:10044-Heterococcus_DN1.PRE.1
MAPKPDRTCYEYVLDTCIAAGMKDVALKTFTAMEQRHIEPTERMYAALVRGFGDALELESALGVWQELRERYYPPCRASFETIIDACVQHPQGLQHASVLIQTMKRAGFSLAADHYSVLIRGFGDAKNMQAALGAFNEMSNGAVTSGTVDCSIGWEVSEDTFAALLEACVRSGEAKSASEAI